MPLPEKSYYTFLQLVSEWKCDDEYLHHLIATGIIVPSIQLKNCHPTDIFYGGAWVGDTDGITHHMDCADYYVGTILTEPNHPENWPEFGPFVYCHNPKSHPSDPRHNNYVFEYFSESPSPNMSKQWFSSETECVNGRSEGERRFIFTAGEVKRVELFNQICKPQLLLDGNDDQVNIDDVRNDSMAANIEFTPEFDEHKGAKTATVVDNASEYSTNKTYQHQAVAEDAEPVAKNIPGKLPNILIGKLAVKAAWKLETESTPRQRATAKDVLHRLQQWAAEGTEADTLRKSGTGNRCVMWMTLKCVEKKYTLAACEKTLVTWNKSRQ